MPSKKRLTEEQCYQYFREQNTPSHVIAHCEAVSDAAVRIGKQMAISGHPVDLELIRMAGLIHDVCRLEKDHEMAGAQLLLENGYPEEAAIVRGHMRYSFRPIEEFCEADAVCLADRVVKEDQYVGIDRRVDYLIHKPGENPERTQRLLQAKEYSIAYIKDLEREMGCTLDSLFAPDLDHFLKRVEKPARYIGGEQNIIIREADSQTVRFAFAFPDLYEIGMSYMGLQILYHIINLKPGLSCERVFAPANDMEELMREENIPLFSLETKTPVGEMDALGFTLQYEMSFTNVLNMLELAGMPLLASERDDSYPVVMAGGPCAFNPEPLADFIDLFVIGDGEETLPDILTLLGKVKEEGGSRTDFLRRASTLDGVYIPSFYQPIYDEEGRITSIRKIWEGAPDRVRRSFVRNLDQVSYPTEPLVPLLETVHDRSVIETFRGCTRGCRFCQAGMIYRPVRERTKETVLDLAEKQTESTGHDEMSILSLSTSDHSQFEDLAVDLMEYCRNRNVALSLPSLRLDTFSFRVLDEIQKFKKSGLTFAPEAGTQRLRNVINKGITEDDIYSAVEQAIALGWRHIKLYFMIGLPGETDEDLDGIAEIARKIIQIHKSSGQGGRFNVTVSISNFVPKAHTPFQWEPQDSTEEFRRKHDYLTQKLRIKGVSYRYHDDAVSTCEAVFARGDRRLSELLICAHEAGCKFDAWSEKYQKDTWDRLMEEWSIDFRFYTERRRSTDEILPWDIIDSGVRKEYLLLEKERAEREETTPDCRRGCTGCGVNRYTECPMGGIYE